MSARRVFALLWILCTASPASAGTLFYAFEDATKKGGIAKVEVDPVSGALTGHEVLWTDAQGAGGLRLLLNDAGDRALLVCDVKEGKNLFAFDLTKPKAEALGFEFGAKPDGATLRGDVAVVCGSKGRVVAIDLRQGKLVGVFDGKKQLMPAAFKSENAAITEDGTRAIVTFQFDDDEGKAKGHRVAVLSLPELRLLHDIPLPRNHADLHPEKSLREAGPGPELVLTAARSNALLVSLDVYGAVAIANLEGALQGKWDDVAVLSTALDGAFGGAFPDRALKLDVGGKDLAVVVNAGTAGGGCIVDLKERTVAQRFDCPFGLDTPQWLASTSTVAFANCGKKKVRKDGDIEKTKVASRQIVLVDMKPVASGGAPTVRTVEASAALHRLHAVAPETSTLLALLLKTDAGGSRIAAFDAASGKEIGAIEAHGKAKASAFKG